MLAIMIIVTSGALCDRATAIGHAARMCATATRLRSLKSASAVLARPAAVGPWPEGHGSGHRAHTPIKIRENGGREAR